MLRINIEGMLRNEFTWRQPAFLKLLGELIDARLSPAYVEAVMDEHLDRLRQQYDARVRLLVKEELRNLLGKVS